MTTSWLQKNRLLELELSFGARIYVEEKLMRQIEKIHSRPTKTIIGTILMNKITWHRFSAWFIVSPKDETSRSECFRIFDFWCKDIKTVKNTSALLSRNHAALARLITKGDRCQIVCSNIDICQVTDIWKFVYTSKLNYLMS